MMLLDSYSLLLIDSCWLLLLDGYQYAMVANRSEAASCSVWGEHSTSRLLSLQLDAQKLLLLLLLGLLLLCLLRLLLLILLILLFV